MADYRRKIFFIDKLFQSKFIILFLALSLLATIGNILFLFLFLKKEVEDNLFRHRIVISNVNEIIVNNVTAFNVVLLIVTTLFAIVFYYLIRRRVRHFISGLEKVLHMKKSGAVPERIPPDLPSEFHELNDVLADFFTTVDMRLEAQKNAVTVLKRFVSSPDEGTRQEVVEKLDNVDKTKIQTLL